MSVPVSLDLFEDRPPVQHWRCVAHGPIEPAGETDCPQCEEET